MIRQLTIIGVGLIGGSLARALKQVGQVGEVVGCSRNQAHLQDAQKLGVIDRFTTDIGAAVQGADMVLLAVPLGAMEDCFRAMVGHLGADTVVTDAGSAKASVVAAAQAAFGELPSGFVPGHPIAGTEQSGVQASFAELYRNRRVILTPLASSSPAALEAVRNMWQATGAFVDEMGVEHHDEVLAATSHLPHLLAYGLVDTLVSMDESEEIFRFAAGGFRDFTRIASSDAVVWRDICLANQTALLAVLERYRADLENLTELVRRGDGEALGALFTRAKAARGRFVDQLEK